MAEAEEAKGPMPGDPSYHLVRSISVPREVNTRHGRALQLITVDLVSPVGSHELALWGAKGETLGY